MPGEGDPVAHQPVAESLRLTASRAGSTKCRQIARSLASALRDTACRMLPALIPVSIPAGALAQAAQAEEILRFSSTDIMLLAVFGGAMSFAILSASWLIRERARMVGENRELRSRLSDLRLANDRLDALANASDQRIVVWNGTDERPTVMGRLSKSSGAPQERSDFLAFGRWLTPESAISFEGAVNRLRKNAETFDMPLVTRKGVVEAQGRISGSHAFVRFIELSGERSALARLEAEHANLLATMDSIQAMFEKLSFPVWLRDRTGELFWVNSAYARAVDCSGGEEAINRRLQLLDSAERNEVTRRQRESGHFTGILSAVVSGDRKSLEITEIRSEAGYAGLAIDRSEIEALWATLRQTQETHAHTLDHLSTAVAMFDGHQKLQFCNSSLQKLFDLSPALLESQPTNGQVLDTLRAQRKLPEFADWRKWREQQLSIFKALEAREEYWHLPDGRTLRVVVNPHNQGGATWLFDNVTEQLELRTNYNSLMRTQGETLDNLSEAVAVFGSDGRLKLSNPAFSAIWGLSPDECATGTHVSTLDARIPRLLGNPADWDRIREALTGYDDDRGDRSGRLETTGGKIIDYALVRLPVGQTMLALVDVTASIRIERALKERNEALEQAAQLKNRFLQHVSYELRAPLTSISGFAELLGAGLPGALNPAQHEYLGYILSASSTLKTIIDDILDLATIDAGAMSLDLEILDLEGVAKQCVADIQDECERRGIRIELSIEPDSGRIQADRQRLNQILANLLSNAVDFSPDGGRIEIASRRGAQGIEIAVTDEGPGVPEEYREALFERFESRNAGQRRRGAGLGLSIVRSFVELHGGQVHVEPAPGRGSRFVCRFPAESRMTINANG